MLQQLGADALGALAQFAARGRDRAAGHHHRTRAPGARRVRRHRGVAEDDAHLGDIDAEHLVRDLGERRLHALPVRMHADAQFEAAVRRQARGCLFVPGHHRNAPAGIDRRAVRGLLAIDGNADADPAAVGFALALACAHALDVDRRQGAAHRLGIIAAVEMLLGDVVERHLLRPHQIAQAHFARLQPRFRRDQIEHQFQREADAGAGHAAIGQDRTLVGGDRKRPAAIGRHQVRAGQDAGDLRRLEARRERIGRVGAGIDGRLAVDAAQPAVAIGIDGDLVMVLAAIGAGGEMLAAILDPAHRDGRDASSATTGRLLPAAECPCGRSRRRRRAK